MNCKSYHHYDDYESLDSFEGGDHRDDSIEDGYIKTKGQKKP